MAKNNSKVSIRYAKALFQLSLEKSVLQEVERDLFNIKQSLLDKAVLRNLSRLSIHKISFQTNFILNISNQLGLTNLTTNLLLLLARRRRLTLLVDIINRFTDFCTNVRNEVNISIISAFELSKDHKTFLIDQLSAILVRKINIHYKIDAAILGGVKMQIGSNLFDNSLMFKLRNLKNITNNVILENVI